MVFVFAVYNALMMHYNACETHCDEMSYFDSYGDSTFIFETPSTENIDSILYEDEESVDSDDTINNLDVCCSKMQLFILLPYNHP